MSLRLSKPPLITPSASPQPPRFSSRIPDRPSPSKKQRRTLHDSSPASNSRTRTPTPDVQKEREASMLRLLDVWGSLAERYSRHMDDDDLVDIRTGEIIIDNGVLRNAPTLEFGSLAAPEDETNEDEADDEEDEYGLDELDFFAAPGSDTDEGSKSELDIGGTVPSFGQPYADDLREFLEAEKIRKEQCGTDVDEESEGQRSFGEGSVEDNADDMDEVELVAEREPGCSYDIQERDGRDNGDGLTCVGQLQDDSEPLDVTSDDELDFWGDDSGAVRVVRKDEVNVIDSDIEIIEPTILFSSQGSSPTYSSTGSKNTTSPKFRQLHTPPRSHSSSRPSVSPIAVMNGDITGPSDVFGDDSSPSNGHRQKINLCNKPHPSSLPNFTAHKGSVSKTKQKPVVLLTPRKALKQPTPLAKCSNGDFSCLERSNSPDDVPLNVSSLVTPSRKKGKGKQRDDTVVPTAPDKHSKVRKVQITEEHARASGPDDSVGEPSSVPTPQGPDFAKASLKQLGKRPQSHSLKRKRDSNIFENVSEVSPQENSPKRHIAGGYHSSRFLQGSSKDLSSPRWHSRESQTDSESEYDDEPVSERVNRKRSSSCIEPQNPPPSSHFLYPYTTPNRQSHVSNKFAPLPDPRAQLIIAQAVQQLSALVTGTWQPPAPHYLEGDSPRTPHHRSMSTQPPGSLRTPLTHPYLYDPNFSRATLPPESPEQEYHATPSRGSLVSRSHSRGRKVSFQFDVEESEVQEISPEAYRTSTSTRKSMTAERALPKADLERDDHKERKRGQTPGPSGNSRRGKHL